MSKIPLLCNVGTQAAATASASLAMVVLLDGCAWQRSSRNSPTGGVGGCLSSHGQDVLCSVEVSAWRQLFDYARCSCTHAGTEVAPSMALVLWEMQVCPYLEVTCTLIAENTS